MLDEVRVGDLVTGDHGSSKMYNYTNDKMLVGEVTAIDCYGCFTVKILDHVSKSLIGNVLGGLKPKFFNYAKGYTPFYQNDDDCSGDVIHSLWGEKSA